MMLRLRRLEQKTSLDSATPGICYLEAVMAQLKVAQAKDVRNATRLVTTDESVPVDSLKREVTVMKNTCKNSLAEVCF